MLKNTYICICIHSISNFFFFFFLSPRMQGSIHLSTRLLERLPPPIRLSGVPLQTTPRSHPQCPPDFASLSSARPPPQQTTSQLPIDHAQQSNWLPPAPQERLLHPPPLPQKVGIIPLRKAQRQAGNQSPQKINHSSLPRLVSHLAGWQPLPPPPMVSRAL